jgi:hypothetical protein
MADANTSRALAPSGPSNPTDCAASISGNIQPRVFGHQGDVGARSNRGTQQYGSAGFQVRGDTLRIKQRVAGLFCVNHTDDDCYYINSKLYSTGEGYRSKLLKALCSDRVNAVHASRPTQLAHPLDHGAGHIAYTGDADTEHCCHVMTAPAAWSWKLTSEFQPPGPASPWRCRRS